MIRLNRRDFAAVMAGGVLMRGDDPLLRRFGEPPMLAAGFIARRGDGRARRMIDGLALRGGGRWSAFGYDDPFRVASVSKMIAARGFMELVLAGRVDLDADVATYLGAPFRHPLFPDHVITVRMLMSHCSGLRNGSDYPVAFNLPLLERLRRAVSEPDFGGWFSVAVEPPGYFSYADVNFALVAEILEGVSGERFDRYMHRTLFAPLGLDVGYNWSGVSQAKRARSMAGCHFADGAWTPGVDANPPRAPEIAFYRVAGDANSTEADYRIGQNGFALAPQGGLRVSLSDMDHLAQHFAHHGGPAIETMATPAWTFDPTAPNGETVNGFYQRYGLGMQLPLGRAAPGQGDAFFGEHSSDWRGHFGDAYGLITALFWNTRTSASLVYVINGMPEENRPPAQHSSITAPEETIIGLALEALH